MKLKLPTILKINYRSKKLSLPLRQLFLIIACLLTVGAIITQRFIIQKRAEEYSASLNLPNSLIATVGTDINIPIFLSTDTAFITGVDVVIRFDKNKLSLTDVVANAAQNTSLKTFAPVEASGRFNTSIVIQRANNTGMIEFSALTFNWSTQTKTSPFRGNNITLATLKFRPLTTGTTNISFVFTPGSSTDSNIVAGGDLPTDILNSVTNLSLSVSSGENCPRKTDGDGNCDGSIGGIDYSIWLNSQCRRSPTQTCARTDADFNGDSNVDDDDCAIWFGKRGT